jgi:hypothetical protein
MLKLFHPVHLSLNTSCMAQHETLFRHVSPAVEESQDISWHSPNMVTR